VIIEVSGRKRKRSLLAKKKNRGKGRARTAKKGPGSLRNLVRRSSQKQLEELTARTIATRVRVTVGWRGGAHPKKKLVPEGALLKVPGQCEKKE